MSFSSDEVSARLQAELKKSQAVPNQVAVPEEKIYEAAMTIIMAYLETYHEETFLEEDLVLDLGSIISEILERREAVSAGNKH